MCRIGITTKIIIIKRTSQRNPRDMGEEAVIKKRENIKWPSRQRKETLT
jgi:hypothetical protein